MSTQASFAFFSTSAGYDVTNGVMIFCSKGDRLRVIWPWVGLWTFQSFMRWGFTSCVRKWAIRNCVCHTKGMKDSTNVCFFMIETYMSRGTNSCSDKSHAGWKISSHKCQLFIKQFLSPAWGCFLGRSSAVVKNWKRIWLFLKSLFFSTLVIGLLLVKNENDSQNKICCKFVVLGCYANFVETNPYETRNTNLISPDVATKL